MARLQAVLNEFGTAASSPAQSTTRMVRLRGCSLSPQDIGGKNSGALRVAGTFASYRPFDFGIIVMENSCVGKIPTHAMGACIGRNDSPKGGAGISAGEILS